MKSADAGRQAQRSVGPDLAVIPATVSEFSCKHVITKDGAKADSLEIDFTEAGPRDRAGPNWGCKKFSIFRHSNSSAS